LALRSQRRHIRKAGLPTVQAKFCLSVDPYVLDETPADDVPFDQPFPLPRWERPDPHFLDTAGTPSTWTAHRWLAQRHLAQDNGDR
jgi:hypothetical protein